MCKNGSLIIVVINNTLNKSGVNATDVEISGSVGEKNDYVS